MPDAGVSARVFPVIAIESKPESRDVRPVEPVVSVESHEIESPLDARLVLLAEPTSSRAEAFRLLRHRLQSRGDPRVISVTSALAGEGKTTCAANLALAIAEESSKSVLLLDANRLRPALAEVFGVELENGVADNPKRHRYTTHAFGDTLFLAEVVNHKNSEARIDRLLLELALADLGSTYDYIVIDGPAVNDGVDSVVLSELSDGVIFAIKTGVTNKRRVRRALEALPPGRVLGSVLLDV